MTPFKLNLGIAAAAIAGPAWLHHLSLVSPILSLLLQLLGIALAALQIVKLLRDWNKPKS